MIARRELGLLGILWLAILLGWTWLLPISQRWLVLGSVGLLGWQLFWLWQHRTQNRHPSSNRLHSWLGWGNHVSLVRLLCLALLVSLLGVSATQPNWVWAAGGLALANALLDYGDGYVARRTNSLSLLGQALDGNLDAFGVLVTVAIALQWQRIGWWYVCAAAARYLFQLGSEWYTRAGITLHPLPANDARRAQAGIQFMFLSCSLLPIFSGTATYWASLAFAVPFLLAFGRDWGVVSGKLAANTYLQPPNWLLLIYRAVTVAVWLWYCWQIYPTMGGGQVGGLLLGVLVLAGGWASRGVAIGLTIWLGILGNLTIPPNSYLPTLLLTIGTIYLGSGQPALWQPESRVLAHRAGTLPPNLT